MTKETIGESEPIRVATFSGHAFGMAAGPIGMNLVVLQQVPLASDAGVTGAVSEPVATINMSPQATKQLAGMLQRVVADYEKQWGEMRLPEE